MNLPKTLQDLRWFIDNQIQESLHLDYKASAAISKDKRGEIAKDVSAFANSDGGLLIYGVEEKGHLPIKVDHGVDHTVYTKEWFDNVITSNIAPRIDGTLIFPIELTPGRFAYAVEVPKSFRGPHQERESKRYYKRFNFKSEPMEDYEIADVRNRRRIVKPLLNVDIETHQAFSIYITIQNIGDVVAEDVSFRFDPPLTWPKGVESATILQKGVHFFPPGRIFKFRYHTFPQILDEKSSLVATFDVVATYINTELGTQMSDRVHIDLRDFLYTSSPAPLMYEQAGKIEKAIKDLKDEVSKGNRFLEYISKIGGASGLDLSVTTLRNLDRLLMRSEQLEKIDPIGQDYRVFQEVLSIDVHLAGRLSDYFWPGDSSKPIQEIEGITEEVIKKLQKHFRIDS